LDEPLGGRRQSCQNAAVTDDFKAQLGVIGRKAVVKGPITSILGETPQIVKQGCQVGIFR